MRQAMYNTKIGNPTLFGNATPIFAARMQRREAITAALPVKEPTAMPAHKRVILSAENHRDTADLLVYVLGYAGYEVLTVDDSIDALKLVRGQAFDLFLIGDLLPVGSSVALAREIRKFNIFTPIVFHSARAYPSDIQRGLSAGAQAYLVKPCDPNHLLGTVARHIGFAQALPA